MSDKDIERINSLSAELRGRQNAAARASKINKVPKPVPIIDNNADAFIAQALSNGLDLAAIEAAAIAKKTNTKK